MFPVFKTDTAEGLFINYVTRTREGRIQPWWLGVLGRQLSHSVDRCIWHTVDRILLGTKHGTSMIAVSNVKDRRVCVDREC